MSETLCSVGIDIGTTSTQLIVSRLKVENRASGFSVPEMEIAQREILYESPIHFTPLLGDTLVDGEAIRKIVESEYQKANLNREDVDTGAIIITGESSRKENAKAVLSALSEFAGEFVVATAGPDLESILAAKGAGAVAYSEETGKTVLHIDIGGGTSNLALIEDGAIVQTGCFHVGGRLLKLSSRGEILHIAPILRDLDIPKEPYALAEVLTGVLEMAAGLRQPDSYMDALFTKETATPWIPPNKPVVISFSGGVADCIETGCPDFAFGDMGPILGRAIRHSRLCAGEYRLGAQTIRATVIGAGCHSTQLSGSTVFHRGVCLPLKNLPVAVFSRSQQEQEDFARQIAEKQKSTDGRFLVIAIPGYTAPDHKTLSALSEKIANGCGNRPVLVCLEADIAKALGHSLCLRLPKDSPCLCIDKVRLQEESFLDIGVPVGPAVPVVIKTLVLTKQSFPDI